MAMQQKAPYQARDINSVCSTAVIDSHQVLRSKTGHGLAAAIGLALATFGSASVSAGAEDSAARERPDEVKVVGHQMDNYLARVKTKDFDYDMLAKIQRDFQHNCQKSNVSKLIRVIRQEGIGSAVKKGAKLIFH